MLFESSEDESARQLRDELTRMRKKARQLGRQGKHLKAIALFEEVLAKTQSPSYKDFAGIGLCQFEEEDFDDAVASLSRALELRPDSITTLRLRANAYFHLQQYQNALRDHDSALSVNEDQADILCDRGRTNNKLGRFQEAFDDFSRASELRADYADALLGRARVCATELHRPEIALKDASHVLRLSPENPQAHFCRGVARYYLHRYQKAIRDLTGAIARAPMMSLAFSMRGLCYRRVGEFELALQDMTKAVELMVVPNDRFLYNRGCLLVRLGRREEALKDFSEAIHVREDFAEAFAARAGAFVGLDRLEEGIADYTTAMTMNPSLVDAKHLRDRASAYSVLGRFPEALNDYDAAIEKSPSDSELFFWRGLVYSKIDDKNSEAIADFSQAISLKADFSKAYTLRGLELCRVDRFAEAVRDLKRALELDQSDQDAIRALAYAEAEMTKVNDE